MSMTELPKAALDALRFEEKTLANGLTLRLLPMPGYGAVHAVYSTGFGSIHRAFERDGKTLSLPAGIAHFLEHKMFENEDGVDAFALFAATGASANAYTSFDRTSYIFTATSEIDRNLDILLSFVGHPHFTKKTVAKEQGIIGQEIGMYEDSAEMRSLFGLLECLYHSHPVRDDIAGTVASIAEITPELLYACTEAFYNPANMALCAAGNLSMSQLEAAAERAGLPAASPAPVRRIFPAEAAGVVRRRREIKMPISLPMFAIGFKETPAPENSTRTEVLCDLLCELLCGETSLLYRRLYDEGLVQPGFGGEFGCYEGCLQFIFAGEGPKPEAVQQAVLEEITRQRREGIDAEQFAICKKMMYGEAIADLESVERVAALLSSSHFRHRSPADELEAIASVTLEEVQEALGDMLQAQRSAMHIIRPM